MTNTNPMQIRGNWTEGYVLDYHTVSSEYLGDDEYGHPQFKTEHTEIGELLYRLKYRGDRSVIEELAEVAAGFVKSWQPRVEVIVPVPASRSDRREQPVLLLAEAMGRRLGIPVRGECLVKAKELSELKNVFDRKERRRLLDGAYRVATTALGGKEVLVLDDLYRSGATMSAVAHALRSEGSAANVYVLALTRTRRRR